MSFSTKERRTVSASCDYTMLGYKLSTFSNLTFFCGIFLCQKYKKKNKLKLLKTETSETSEIVGFNFSGLISHVIVSIYGSIS